MVVFLSASERSRVPGDAAWIVAKADAALSALESAASGSSAQVTALKEKLERASEKAASESGGKALEEALAAREADEQRASAAERQVATLKDRLATSEELARYRQQAVEELQRELEAANARVREVRNELRVAESAKAKQGPQHFEEDLALSQRKLELKEKEIEWLQATLKEKAGEIEQLREKRTVDVSSIESKLEAATHNERAAQAKLEALQAETSSTKRAFEAKIDTLNKKLQLLEDDNRSLERILEKEEGINKALHAQAKDTDNTIVGLQAEIEAKTKALSELVESQEKNVRDIEGTFNVKLEDITKAHEAEIGAVHDEIEALKAERDQAQARVQKLLELSPAATVSDLSKHGLSSTQLYEKVRELEDERDANLEEIQELKSYMERILRDVESRAPEMTRLRKEHDRAMENYDRMSYMHAQIQEDAHALKIERDELVVEMEKCTAELHLKKLEARDLAQQVAFLLKAQSKSTVKVSGLIAPPHTPQTTVDSNAMVLSASDIIKQNVGPIESEESLVRENHILRSVTYRLEGELEKKQNEIDNLVQGENQKELEKLRNELELTHQSRERTEIIMGKLVQQRDALRALLYQSESSNLNALSNEPEKEGVLALQDKGVLAASSPDKLGPFTGPATTRNGALESKSILKDYKEAFDKLREDARESVAQLQGRLDEQKEELSKARLEATKASAEQAFTNTRCEELQNQLAIARQELQREQELRSNSFKEFMNAQTLLGERSGEIERLKSQLNSEKGDKVRIESLCSTLKTECEHLKTRAEDLLKQRDAQTDLVSAVNQMDENRSTEQHQLISSIKKEKDSLQETIANLRAQLRENRQTSLEVALKNNMEIKELREKAQRAEEISTKAQEAAKKYEADLDRAKDREATLREQLEANRKIAAQVRQLRMNGSTPQTDGTAGTSANDDVSMEDTDVATKTSKGKVEEHTAQLGKLMSQLEAKTKDSEAFRQIAKMSEDTLNKIKLSSDKFKRDCEAKISALEQERDELKEKYTQVSTTAATSRSEIESKAAALEEKVKALQSRATDAENAMAAANASSVQAKKDAEMHAKAARSAQENYDRELQLHAIAVSKVTDLSEKLAAAEQRLSKTEEDAKMSSESLKKAEKEWAEAKASLDAQITSLRLERIDLARQNELLTSQTTTLNTQVQEMQRRLLGSSNEAVSGGGSEEATKAEITRLRELLELTQRQRDVAVVEREDTELRLTRAQSLLARAEEESKQARSQLQSQVESVGGSDKKMLTVEEHNRLLASVTENTMLRNMNAMLSAEHDKLKEKAKALEESLAKASKQLEPYEAGDRKLDAQIQSLEADKAALEKECGLYRTRYDDLLKRFGDKVDPSEHEKVEKDAAAQAQEIKNLKEALEASESKFTRLQTLAKKARLDARQANQALEALKTEAGPDKNRVKELEKSLQAKDESLEKMRTSMNSLKSEISSLKARSSGQPKENTDTPEGTATLAAATPITTSGTSSAEVASADQSKMNASTAAANEKKKQEDDARKKAQKEQLKAKLAAMKKVKAERDAAAAAAAAASAQSTDAKLGKRKLNPSAPSFTPPQAGAGGESNAKKARSSSPTQKTAESKVAIAPEMSEEEKALQRKKRFAAATTSASEGSESKNKAPSALAPATDKKASESFGKPTFGGNIASSSGFGSNKSPAFGGFGAGATKAVAESGTTAGQKPVASAAFGVPSSTNAAFAKPTLGGLVKPSTEGSSSAFGKGFGTPAQFGATTSFGSSKGQQESSGKGFTFGVSPSSTRVPGSEPSDASETAGFKTPTFAQNSGFGNPSSTHGFGIPSSTQGFGSSSSSDANAGHGFGSSTSFATKTVDNNSEGNTAGEESKAAEVGSDPVSVDIDGDDGANDNEELEQDNEEVNDDEEEIGEDDDGQDDDQEDGNDEEQGDGEE